MEELIEPIPKTQNIKQFPIGDIGLEASAQRLVYPDTLDAFDEIKDAYDYINDLSRKGRHELQLWYRRAAYETGPIRKTLKAWSSTVLEAKDNYVHEDDLKQAENIANIGFNTVIAISRKGLLPPIYKNMDDAIEELGTLDKNQLEFFTNNAWTTMHMSHPNVYGVLSQWARSFSRTLDIRAEPELLVMEASMVLPYQLSSVARGGNYLEVWIDGHNKYERTISG